MGNIGSGKMHVTSSFMLGEGMATEDKSTAAALDEHRHKDFLVLPFSNQVPTEPL